MDEQLSLYYSEFKRNARPIFVLCVDPPDPVLGSFVIRKLNADQIAIVAWLNKDDAEEFRMQSKQMATYVREVWYEEFKRMLNEVSPEDRKAYKLELR